MGISIKHALTVVAVLAGISSAATAQVYVGAAFGSTEYQDAEYFGIDNQSTAFEMTAGWRFQPTLAMEASYLNLGSVEDYVLGSDINVSGLTLSGKAFLPLAPQVDLYAKMGIFFWQMDEVYPNQTYYLDQGEDLMFGGGLAFHLDAVDLNLEYRKVDLYDMDTSVVTAGATFQF